MSMRDSHQGSRDEAHTISFSWQSWKTKCLEKSIYEINCRLVDNLEEKTNY